MTNSLNTTIDRLWPDYLELLQQLVKQPSTLGNERAAQDIVYRHLRGRMNLPAELWDLDLGALAPHPQFAPTGWSYQSRPNVTALWHGTGGGRSLVLNSHIDVVSPEPLSWWSYNPWGATIVGNRMYGRGALDMKSGLVAMLLALQAVMASGATLRGSVWVESVIEEECTGNGMLAARLRSGRVDGAIIPELTSLRAWTATLGVVWFEVTVRGKPAYVGAAGAYINANEAATALIARLKPPMVEELNALPRHPAFANHPQPFVLNVGTITGGDWPTNVPLECRFTCRMAFPIGWSFTQVQAFIERHLARAIATDSWLAKNPPTLRYPGFRALGWEIDDHAPLVQLLEQCHSATVGTPLERDAFPGTADARYFTTDEQAIYYGPAGSNQHAPDEYVALDSIVPVARVLAQLILEWCG
jgi:acetylornithine deacetylase